MPLGRFEQGPPAQPYASSGPMMHFDPGHWQPQLIQPLQRAALHHNYENTRHASHLAATPLPDQWTTAGHGSAYAMDMDAHRYIPQASMPLSHMEAPLHDYNHEISGHEGFLDHWNWNEYTSELPVLRFSHGADDDALQRLIPARDPLVRSAG